MTTVPYIPALHERPHYLNVSYKIRSWLLTLDHKRIAILYLVSIVVFFIIGGAAAHPGRTNGTNPDPRRWRERPLRKG